MIGSGNYGQVYLGTYDGNRVAIKTFPELENSALSPSLPALHESNTKSRSLKAIKSFSPKSSRSGPDGYKQVHTTEDEEDSIPSQSETLQAPRVDPAVSEYEKKMYALRKEIYSEVVLACSLPPHPNLVQILGLTRDPLKIVMSYYEGGSLQTFVYRQLRRIKYDQITLRSIIILLQKMAEGVVCLHAQKIVHRDIAARNVLLGRIESDGQIHEQTQVVISDFGMTRHCDMGSSSSQRGRGVTKQKVGPIRWMAPESILHRKYSDKTDVYMFGITMWEVMHGKEPYSEAKFQSVTLAELARRVVKQGERPVIDEKYELESILGANDKAVLIGRINKLMKRCWAEEAKDRPDMWHVLRKLNAIYDSMLGLNPKNNKM